MTKQEFDTLLESLAFKIPTDVDIDILSLQERKEDMSPDGKLQSIVQPDGDAIIGIVPAKDESSIFPSVEFCTPIMGGGRSPRVHKVLRILAVAMALDNLENPIG